MSGHVDSHGEVETGREKEGMWVGRRMSGEERVLFMKSVPIYEAYVFVPVRTDLRNLSGLAPDPSIIQETKPHHCPVRRLDRVTERDRACRDIPDLLRS